MLQGPRPAARGEESSQWEHIGEGAEGGEYADADGGSESETESVMSDNASIATAGEEDIDLELDDILSNLTQVSVFSCKCC